MSKVFWIELGTIDGIKVAADIQSGDVVLDCPHEEDDKRSIIRLTPRLCIGIADFVMRDSRQHSDGLEMARRFTRINRDFRLQKVHRGFLWDTWRNI